MQVIEINGRSDALLEPPVCRAVFRDDIRLTNRKLQ
jgi:hypothetical protein